MQKEDPDISGYFQYRHSTDSKQDGKNSKTPAVKVLLRQSKHLVLYESVLYREVNDPKLGCLRQLVLPASLKSKVLTSLHDDFGHQGEERTLSLARLRCYWPYMYRDIKNWIQGCERCSISKSPIPAIRNPLGHLIASRPLEIVAIDFTLLEPSTDHTENVLVITDVFSKFTVAVPTKDQTAKTSAAALVKEWFQKYGAPQRIHSDQGRQFESALIQDLCGF